MKAVDEILKIVADAMDENLYAENNYDEWYSVEGKEDVINAIKERLSCVVIEELK